MKYFGVLLLLVSSFAFANTPTQDCYKIADKLDRDYCHAKKMKKINSSLKKQRASWKKTLTKSNKSKLSKNLAADITTREAQIKMLQDELNAIKNQEQSLAKAPVVKTKKKKKEKKKNDLEKALGNLGIKL